MTTEEKKEKEGELEWFISLRETIQEGDYESALQAIEGMIGLLNRLKSSGE